MRDALLYPMIGFDLEKSDDGKTVRKYWFMTPRGKKLRRLSEYEETLAEMVRNGHEDSDSLTEELMAIARLAYSASPKTTNERDWALIGYRERDGKVFSMVVTDVDPLDLGRTLSEFYPDEKKARGLVWLGDCVSVGKSLEETVAFHRDKGDPWEDCSPTRHTTAEFWNYPNCSEGCTAFLFSDGKWSFKRRRDTHVKILSKSKNKSLTRLEYNRKILDKLSETVEKFPDMRFHQILVNSGVEKIGEDKFYEESEKTWEKMEG